MRCITTGTNRIMNRRITTAAICGGLLFTVACGGSGSSSGGSTGTTPPSNNVLAISVNAGPNGGYANGAFASVTVCVPSTTTCQTIDDVLVDTGSSGLRLLSSVLTAALPQQKASDGNAVVECLPFVSGYTWGPVQTADIELSGEKASSVPIQVISGSDFPVPTACANFGSPQETLSALGANGILGVGTMAQDCGQGCESASPIYWECPASGCVEAGESLALQVQNPVALFSTDNNGVIIELPAVSGPELTLSGSLIFGIGTQSNNALNGATVYTVDDDGNFITTYNNQSYNQSFIDSGSNGFYFLDSSATGIPVCSDANYFYCPSSTQNLTVTNAGSTGTPSGTVSFSVANADNLFNNYSSDNVFEQLAGPNSLSGFDWGLPFFYGRNVFTAIQGQNTPGGTGPYWAY
jgi:Protein of unknown function (DUF3443)